MDLKRRIFLFAGGGVTTLVLAWGITRGLPALNSYTQQIRALPQLQAQVSDLANQVVQQKGALEQTRASLDTLKKQAIAQGQTLQEALDRINRMQGQINPAQYTQAIQELETTRRTLNNVQISLQGLAATQKEHSEFIGAILGALPSEPQTPPSLPQPAAPPAAPPPSGEQALPIPDSF